MPKRRANGEGNIRKRKDGRWEGRYTAGYDQETGKRIIKNVLCKTQAEVKEKLKKAIEENVGIDYGRAKTYTVGSWLEVWMENYARVKLRPSTFKTSQGFLKNHIKPQIGGIPLADLTSLDLQRFYKHLLDGGRVDRIEAKKKPKGLAPKTVRNIHQMIGSAYNLAIEQHLVTKIQRKLGYNTEVLGFERIHNTTKRIRREARSPEGFHEGARGGVRIPGGGNNQTEGASAPSDEAARRMKREILCLQQQMAFLKKVMRLHGKPGE